MPPRHGPDLEVTAARRAAAARRSFRLSPLGPKNRDRPRRNGLARPAGARGRELLLALSDLRADNQVDKAGPQSCRKGRNF